MIQPGDAVPSVPVKLVDSTGARDVSSDEVLGAGRVVLFAVPGAFTPTCHNNHLPGFLANAGKIRDGGVDRIVCAAANDQFVVQAWAEASDAVGKVDFLADGNAELAKELGVDRDLSAGGLGTRYARCAMIFDDGRAEHVFVEDQPGDVTGSGAASVLVALSASMK